MVKVAWTCRSLLKPSTSTMSDIQAVLIDSTIFGADAGEQLTFTCTPATINDFGEFSDYQCSGRDVAGDVVVSLKQRSGDRVSFQLAVPTATMDVLPQRVDFDYTVQFRAPVDLNGNAFMCGSEACPARPDVSGKMGVLVPSSVSVLTDMTIEIGSEEPTSFSDLTSLDVNRELKFGGAIIPGAFEYELVVYCPASFLR